ncbi:MAG TPA: hypothetical protein ENJ20_04300 [Bacteroidetes bacterium]|nr:hypothetical protein [Bacteroidota bacterium]
MKKLPPALRNKYFIVLASFFFLMVFVDKHDLLTQIRLKNSVNRLKHDKEYFEKEIEKAKEDRLIIEQNKEKFAREKYHMHKQDEEVFVIEKKD